MAKRHKHYDNRHKKSKKKSGGKPSGKVKSTASHGKKKTTAGRGDGSWVDSSVPGGSVDFGMNFDKSVQNHYFGNSKNKNRHNRLRDGVFRPGYNRDSEDSYFENSSFRKRPMVFVKSDCDWNSADAKLKRLIKINNKKTKNNFKDLYESDELENSSENDLTEDIQLDNNHAKTVVSHEETSDSEDILEGQISIEDVADTEPETSDNNDIQQLDNDDLYFVDDDPEPMQKPVKSVHVEEPVFSKTPSAPLAVSFDPILTVGKVELKVSENEDSGKVTTDIHPAKAYHPFRDYISNVMDNMETMFSDEDEFMEDDMDYEIMYDEMKSQQESSVFSQAKDIVTNIENLNISESTNSINNRVKEEIIEGETEEIIEVKKEPEYPEFGFCEEDFAVNTSDLTVSNIRFGAQSNSYYFQAYKLFGDYDSRWADQDILVDFILETMGLPEHRLNAFLDYIRNCVVPDEEPSEPNFDDMPFSDTSEEEESDDSDNEELTDDRLEGVDDLVYYSMKYGNQRNIEYETKSIQTTGKGTKKKLLIRDDMAMDNETINELQSKLCTRLSNKAKKKKSKLDFIEQEHAISEDLYKKYPLGLHILNIKDEFDNYYNDKNKKSLIFPPLDPHGNKTIRNIAKYYSMKTTKIGSGRNVHMAVQKLKITYRRTPNYNIINNITEQRPIFLRFDVDKPQKEHKRTETIRLSKFRKAHGVKQGNFTVKEGELVGEHAPELGHDNIGMRMLMKLGWNKGEGLGTMGLGISEPVLATVKTSKKGLGHQDASTNSARSIGTD
ncbi:hypothetical protein TPHA_0P01730 [Tetrapisispora phaffii CBS 4417]|uniref:G-patch domain-containing protein n=1 Tax=Tetrapisispora phaffii (strain ATCC 24235 / CBS 4417 / NBRC 1672 / NRRL Y-8282 / UCD 70-5) TaxID=1071381 RepID=G8C2F2_TETPH|nr:hypothetical protein TPHA_0P01730 [Tetrapisispora phaffii CBS 4417]CCE66330.1 hypothetical protein TPHA_0P01730 [Tetrapisispora phaffii CBS 4417]